MPENLSAPVDRPWLLGSLCLALAVRCGMAWARADQLTIDRDAYLGIAENLASGRGFCTPETASPTAYRPPIYPLLLAAAMTVLPPNWSVALWNIAAGVGTVWFVDRLGVALGLGSKRHLASLLVAVDPLLLNATPQPMTEVVFTFLLTGWLWAATSFAMSQARSWRSLLVGLLFGLTALCRPTVWPLAGLSAIAWMMSLLARRSPVSATAGQWNRTAPMLVVLGVALVVSPWVVRNQLVFGRPILTTTHGGYTLLLGNNPVYDRDVVQQPWGTTWPPASLSRWQTEIEDRLRADLGPNPSELERDAWMSAEARRFIGACPARFLNAALRRVHSLWSISPQGEGASLPLVLRSGVAAFYVLEYLLAAAGFWRILHDREWPAWLPGLMLIVAVQGVHLAYWTDARMRTPLEPVLALLAARGTARFRSTFG